MLPGPRLTHGLNVRQSWTSSLVIKQESRKDQLVFVRPKMHDFISADGTVFIERQDGTAYLLTISAQDLRTFSERRKARSDIQFRHRPKIPQGSPPPGDLQLPAVEKPRASANRNHPAVQLCIRLSGVPTLSDDSAILALTSQLPSLLATLAAQQKGPPLVGVEPNPERASRLAARIELYG